jgi:AraC-like DNA-binding protein
MMNPVFEYSEAPPPPELRDVVLSLWSFRATEHCPPTIEHTVWPDGCASLGVVAIPGVPPFALCIQPRADARVTTVHRGSRYWGIRFWPDTGSSILGVPARALRDGPVSGAFAPAAARLVELCRNLSADAGWSALESWSLADVPRAPEVDPSVRAAIRHIVMTDGASRVSEVAAASGLGPRQLQRRFIHFTGLTMKAYARVRRLRAALARQLSVTEPLSRTAAERGYADHAHLAREFADLTGMAPTGALRHLARIEHRNVVP